MILSFFIALGAESLTALKVWIAVVALVVIIGFSLLVSDSDRLLDCLGLLKHVQHQMGDVSP
jgi:hypothetical protein